MKLIIAEKPSLAKTIASAIGIEKNEKHHIKTKDFYVTWVFGHLFELKSVDDYLGQKTLWKDVTLPFIPPRWEYALKKDDGVKAQFYAIKELIGRDDVDEIIHAGDADREGQVIIDVLLANTKESKIKSVTRLWLPEQTPETIRVALKKRKANTEYKHLYDEGLARTLIDWLYGINLTRYTSLKTGSLFPCGRVLIPIVKFIYDRDMAIKNFVKEKYFAVEYPLMIEGHKLTLALKEHYSLKEKAQAKANEMNQYRAVVEKVEEKEIKKQAPKLFSLSTLQQKLSKEHKIGFKESLEIIQKLYEKGLVTYPRTNTEYLAENEKEKIKALIESLSDSHDIIFKDTKAIFDDTKIESHSAITPTLNRPDENTFKTEKERIVYQTILYRFLAKFAREDTLVKELQITISVGSETFTFKGETIINHGFLAYELVKIKDVLPYVKEGQEFNVNFQIKDKYTEPPKKITEEVLSRYLKNPFRKEEDTEEDYQAILKGVEIGTEATRTGIIENAKKYEYISQDKQTFSITDKGIAFINALDQLKINLYKERTVELSVLLKDIYNRRYTISKLLEKVKEDLENTVNQEIEIAQYERKIETYGKCPRCGKEIRKNKKSYYCTGYKEGCTFSLWIDNLFFTNKGHKLTDKRAKDLINGKQITLKNCKSQKSDKTYDMVVRLKDNGTKTELEGSFLNKTNKK